MFATNACHLGTQRGEHPHRELHSRRRPSGSTEGAGGIGGLLARSHGYSGGNFSTHNYYFADGNGNITYMLNSSQAMVASYRYDPFGNSNSFSGSLASANVYRFSSKEIHVNSGMYYYGYRFYDPNLQRWISRDPIAELGGINLYGFVRNAPIATADALGLVENSPACTAIIALLTGGAILPPWVQGPLENLAIELGCYGGGPKRRIPGRERFPNDDNFLPFDPAVNRSRCPKWIKDAYTTPWMPLDGLVIMPPPQKVPAIAAVGVTVIVAAPVFPEVVVVPGTIGILKLVLVP